MTNFNFRATALSFLIAFTLFPIYGFAQFNSVQEEDSVVSNDTLNPFNLAAKSTSSLIFNTPIDIIGNEIPYPIEGFIIRPSAPLQHIGDVNGDGYSDYINVRGLVYFGANEFDIIPDQLLNTDTIFTSYRILPLGDIDNDGFSDAVVYDITNTIPVSLYKGSEDGLVEYNATDFETYFSNYFERRYLNNNSTTITNIDYNGDSFPDIISSFYSDSSRYNVITLGSSSIFEDGFDTQTYTIRNDRSAVRGFLVGHFNQDDNDYFVFENQRCDFFPDNPLEYVSRTFVDIFELTDADSLKLNTSIYYPYRDSRSCRISTSNYFRNLILDDLNQDGFMDILYHNAPSNTIIPQLGTGTIGDSLTFNNPFLIDEFTDAVVQSIIIFRNAGDLNNDGSNEYYYYTGLQDKLIIGNFMVTGDSTTSWNTLLELDSNEFLPESYFEIGSNITPTQSFNDSHRHADVGLNLKRIPFSVINDSNFLTGFIETNPTDSPLFSSFDTTTYSYDIEDFSSITREQVFFLGDLENDGIDNFTILKSNSNYETLEFYNGFYDSTPIIYEIPDSLNVRGVITGKFIDTESDQIVINYLDGFSYNQSSGSFLDIYTSLDFSSPELTYTLSNYANIIENIGDVNNDGFDDFGISHAQTRNNKFEILKGGTNLSEAPDFSTNAEAYLNIVEPFFASTQWGISLIQGIGDINNDTIDDFIISDPNRRILNNEGAALNIYGSFYLFYGKESDSVNFDTPDFEFLPDTSDFSNDIAWHAGLNEIAYGDFNGDSLTDIAAKSFRHQNNDGSNGIGAINYYFGKNTGFESQPDTTIPIRWEYIEPFSFVGQDNPEYATGFGRSLLKAIDVDNDNEDELLFVSGGGVPNAILYKVGNNPTEKALGLFRGPNNQYDLINPSGAFYDKQYNSLVGDFIGDDGLYFLGNLTYSTYRDTPVLLYDLNNFVTTSNEPTTDSPTSIILEQNYPNPFNPSTRIEFNLQNPGIASLKVYNILGQLVSTIVDEQLNSGFHSFEFDASNLASGVYVYRLESNGGSVTKKMMLIK